MLFLVTRVVVLCIVLTVTVLVTIKLLTQKEDPSTCDMTYMYEIPEYIPIKLSKMNSSMFPSYHLYIYGEGTYAASLKQKKYQGVPVLFLPGNSGSYKQVRSLASVALTKSLRSRSRFHFNYFAVDFNEEYSAFYGGVLDKQVEYAAICIKHILRLYSIRPRRPTSVIVVGHSMGGVVARALFQLPNFDPAMVSVIITLATPHRAPVAAPDVYLSDFYSRMHSYWTDERQRRLSRVNLVSIGGGKRDLMVRSSLIHVPGDSRSLRDISIVSTAIPEVWTSMDHLCIVWCNQLVLTIVRATFQMIDPKTEQVSDDVLARSGILHSSFIHGGRRAERWFPAMNEMAIGDIGGWTSVTESQWRYVSSVTSRRSPPLLLPVEKNRSLMIVTEEVDFDPMVVGCQVEYSDSRNDGLETCRATRLLPYRPIYVPMKRGFWKVLLCHPTCHLNETHLLIKMPSTKPNVDVAAEVFDGFRRSVNVSALDGVLGTLVVDVPSGALFYEIGFPSLVDVLPVYTVTFRTLGSGCPELAGVSHFHVPWSSEDSFASIKNPGSKHVLWSSLPKEPKPSVTDYHPRLRLYLRPRCKMMVNVDASIMDSLEQLLRFHVYFLPVFMAAALLRTLSNLFSSLLKTGSCQSPWRSLSPSACLGDLIAIHLLFTVIGSISETIALGELFPDCCNLWALSPDRVLRPFVTASLYLTASAAVCLLLGLVALVASLTGKILAALLTWFRLKEKPRSSSKSRLHVLVTSGLTLMMILVASRTCGVMSLLALQVIASLKLLHSHIRLCRAGRPRERLAKHNQCRLEVCFYMLYGLIFQLSCPTLLFWIKNLRFEQRLDPDPSFVPVLLVILATLVQRTIEKAGMTSIRVTCCRQLSILQRFFSLCILVFGPNHLYRVTWLLAIDAFVLGTWPLLHDVLLAELPDGGRRTASGTVPGPLRLGTGSRPDRSGARKC